VLVHWIRVVEGAVEHSFGIEPTAVASLDRIAVVQLLHERMVRGGLLPRNSEPDVLHGSLRSFAAAMQTQYVPRKSYAGPIDFVCIDDENADAQTNRRQQDELVSGWMRWAPRVRRWNGPGNHLTILKDPHVRRLADWWKHTRSREME
jgi:arthrofactin-type cyclic lipopeptide synthetase C